MLHHVGKEQEPVVVIDDATGLLGSLRTLAAKAGFAPAATVDSHYPGLLAPASVAYLDGLVRFALPLITAHFGTGPVVPARARGNFSLVTTPPDALSPDQRVPHVDAADRMQFAGVHYLSDHPAGTGFFRHRATGYETIDADRLAVYRRHLDAELAASGPGRYVTGNHTHFEAIGAVEPRPDRLILYRAALLHSGLIAALPPHADDPSRGRLTGNLFLQCRTTA
ncbi:DUF6445 family protein [Sphingomonas yabuuchiae]|uniref:DUF6445 family protein n=1 Tax=Sphingomonas yabuuchiae TaxID=172044 RepID=UPI0023DD6E8E|nr:DUF6445 family protein [Sphingomonas yabuuchiae]